MLLLYNLHKSWRLVEGEDRRGGFLNRTGSGFAVSKGSV
jgi:hypothetical protein